MTQKTYCNPLSLPPASSPESPGHAGWHKTRRSLADPTILKFEHKWYLFASGSQAWVSADLVEWAYVDVALPVEVIGPSLVEAGGWFYLSGNNSIGLWRARHPLGPWENLGLIEDHEGKKVYWADLMFFVDDDKRFYTYHHSGSGVGSDGIFVTEMDPKQHYRRALGPSRNCFAYEPSHIWERWGTHNEFEKVAWIEAPWMTKHAGRYYLQYSGAGTEWKSYAVGLYTSSSPLGPFEYDERSPVFREKGGLLNGTGHHALVEGPGGTLWNFYHVLFHNQNKWDRRLAMDPAGFDAQGRLVLGGPSETPQLAPGKAAQPHLDNSAGLLPLSVDKPAKAGGAAEGFPPQQALDGFIRTAWKAADSSFPQWLEVDLLGEFQVQACRVILGEAGRKAEAEGACAFELEGSLDGKSWQGLWKQEGEDRDIFYAQWPPRPARHLRLRFSAMPSGLAASVQEWTAFGK